MLEIPPALDVCADPSVRAWTGISFLVQSARLQIWKSYVVAIAQAGDAPEAAAGDAVTDRDRSAVALANQKAQ